MMLKKISNKIDLVYTLTLNLGCFVHKLILGEVFDCFPFPTKDEHQIKQINVELIWQKKQLAVSSLRIHELQQVPSQNAIN